MRMAQLLSSANLAFINRRALSVVRLFRASSDGRNVPGARLIVPSRAIFDGSPRFRRMARLNRTHRLRIEPEPDRILAGSAMVNSGENAETRETAQYWRDTTRAESAVPQDLPRWRARCLRSDPSAQQSEDRIQPSRARRQSSRRSWWRALQSRGSREPVIQRSTAAVQSHLDAALLHCGQDRK